MKIDYKKELESAARSMILIHDPEALIKLILRMFVQKVRVTHASVLLHDKIKESYVLAVSRGSLGTKIPVGFARMDKDDLLIRFFKDNKDRPIFNRGVLICDEAKKLLKNNTLKPGLKQLIQQALYQMEVLDSCISIPSYFRNELLGILLLGKKKNGKDFIADELNFFIALSSNLAMSLRNAQLFKELELQLDKKHQLFVRTTIALAAAIEAKDNYTHGHTTRVTTLSLEIAKKISQKNKKTFDREFLENLHIASLLHDIGKIGVPEHILNKRGDLTVGEMNKVREHPLIGAAILKPINELEDSLLGVKYHHEKYNGGGYPEGLSGDRIPLIASIISVADSFDAMTTDRPYRTALNLGRAVNEIKGLSGRQFSPLVCDAFAELYRDKYK